MAKKRLDIVLVERGLAESRAQAQALVLAGLVAGFDKPGQQVGEDVALEVERPPRFVSRGGEKLSHALDALGVDPAAGTASTSGPPPAASPTASCSAAPRGSSRSTSATGSSIRGCEAIHASSCSSG